MMSEVYPLRIDEIDNRDAATHGDFLSTKNLCDRLWKPLSSFDRGVVGDHDHLLPLHTTNRCNDSSPRCLTIVEVVPNKHADLHRMLSVVEK